MKKDKEQGPSNSLEQAIKVVYQACKQYEEELTILAKQHTETVKTVEVEGETIKGFTLNLYVPACIPARIMLKYDYPFYSTLSLDAPSAMWDEIAETLGVAHVYYINL